MGEVGYRKAPSDMLTENRRLPQILRAVWGRSTSMSHGDIAAAVASLLIGWAASQIYEAWLYGVVRLSLSAHRFDVVAIWLVVAAVSSLVASFCKPIVEAVRTRQSLGSAVRALPSRVVHSVSNDIEKATGRIFIGLAFLVGGILGPLVSDYGLRLMTTPTTAAITLVLAATALALGGWGARELAIGYLGFAPGRFGTLVKSETGETFG